MSTIQVTKFLLSEWFDGIEIEIEFLTDTATRNDKNKNVVIAGIVAQPLSYLTLNLQTTGLTRRMDLSQRAYFYQAKELIKDAQGSLWDLVRSHEAWRFFRSSAC